MVTEAWWKGPKAQLPVSTRRFQSQARAPVLEAAEDARGAGLHGGAELLAVRVAGVLQHDVSPDVLRGHLHAVLHALLARRHLQLVPADDSELLKAPHKCAWNML